MQDAVDTVDQSMVIDAPDSTTGGGGAVRQPESTRDSVAAAFAESAADEANKDGQAPEQDADADKADSDTEAKAKEGEKDDADDSEAKEKPAEKPVKQSKSPPVDDESVAKEAAESKPKVEAPESFSDRAKEQWRNVPHHVRDDVTRTITEYSKQIEAYRSDAEKYESLRPYGEMADQVGRPLAQVIEGYVNTERTLSQNPLKGLNDIIRNYLPPKADGTPMTLYDVAQYVNGIGQQGLNQTLSQAQVQERQQMQQYQQQQAEAARIQEMQVLRAQLVKETITGPFAAQNEHYDNPDVQATIAKVLQSDIIDPSLPPLARLQEAYDLAVLKHGLQSTTQRTQKEDATSRAGNFGGDPSPQLKSSLGGVSESVGSRAEQGESHEESLRKELRKLRV